METHTLQTMDLINTTSLNQTSGINSTTTTPGLPFCEPAAPGLDYPLNFGNSSSSLNSSIFASNSSLLTRSQTIVEQVDILRNVTLTSNSSFGTNFSAPSSEVCFIKNTWLATPSRKVKQGEF